jgi:hypothetical protein
MLPHRHRVLVLLSGGDTGSGGIGHEVDADDRAPAMAQRTRLIPDAEVDFRERVHVHRLLKEAHNQEARLGRVLLLRLDDRSCHGALGHRHAERALDLR